MLFTRKCYWCFIGKIIIGIGISTMKRVLCIISSLDAGGAETFLMKIYRYLTPLGYQFDFIVSKDGGCYTSEVLELGGKIFVIPTRSENLFGAFNGIRLAVKENQYKYVLKLGEHSLAVLDMLAAKFGGAKVLGVRACNAPTGLSALHRLIHLFCRPFLNYLAKVKIAPSILAANFLFGAKEDVCMLHNGVDLNVFRYDSMGRESIRKEFGLEDKLVIGHIGRFHKQKNHLFLLETFKEISVLREDAILLLVGTGELEEQICERIKSLNLEERVILTGQRFDIPQLLSAMDAFVFPSLYEGMPNTVIEAQATGLPCVIADTITTEANITGLVKYLPLSLSASEWAKIVLNAVSSTRKNTHNDFAKYGYNIESVAKEFISILGMNSDSD